MWPINRRFMTHTPIPLRAAGLRASHHHWDRSVTGTFSHLQRMWGREGETVNNSVINAELTGRPFAMHKVYNLRVLCTKIQVYWHTIWAASQVKLLNRIQFHQLQLKTNQTSWMKRRAHHCVFHSLIMPALDGGRGSKLFLQQSICNHTDLAVGLLGRPVGGQATTHNGGRPTVKCEGFNLNCLQCEQPFRAYCRQYTIHTHFENR